MTENSVDPLRSKIMRSVRRQKTKPEMIVRRWLHGRGYRFRTNLKGLPGRPDIAFTRRKKVIFIHGCFWHRHPECSLASVPKTRSEFWEKKFSANIERDERKARELEDSGWEVLVIWECQTRALALSVAMIEGFIGPPKSY